MKIQPKLYQVRVDGDSSYSKETEEMFNKKQEKYKGLDFLKLAKFDPSNKYGSDILEESIYILGEADFMKLCIKGIKAEIKQEIKVDVDITNQLMDLAQKPIAISMTDGGVNNYNNRCEVHIPNISMLMYNDLMLKEDVCTDELQEELNRGWRIIAACPQPDQRRPDYILGRYNPESEVSNSAAR